MEEENCSLGYIKLFRSLLDWEWFDDSKTLHVFIYCLLRAGYKDSAWKGIGLKSGEFIGSRAQIAEKTRLTDSEVKTALMHLEKTGEITRKKVGKYTIYKVNKYSSYQQIADITPEKRRQIADITPEKPPKDKKVKSKEVKNTTTSYGDTGSGGSDEIHDRQGMHEEPKGSVIDQVFTEFPYGIRCKLNELYIRLRHKPTAAEFEEWRKALAACHSDEERIRMIRYSLGDNQKGRTYKNLYPERGKKTKPDALPIWYDELPDQQPSRKEDVAKARRLREEILGGK